MDLNKVMIIGRLTRDPELKTIPSGASVCQLGIATNFVYTNQQSGQKVENVEYHNVVLWRKLGEIAAQYLKKGQRVYIEGRLQTRSWDDQQSGKKNYKTEIIADNMIMLDGGRGQNDSGASYAAGGAATGAMGAGAMSQPEPKEDLPTIQQGEDINVDDIPF
jgi:single-strand DNA-binding protein